MENLTINGRELSEKDAAVLQTSLSVIVQAKDTGWQINYENKELSRDEIVESVESIAAAVFETEEIDLEIE